MNKSLSESAFARMFQKSGRLAYGKALAPRILMVSGRKGESVAMWGREAKILPCRCVPRVVQESPVCPKIAYIYWLWTPPDAFGRAIYNTAL